MIGKQGEYKAMYECETKLWWYNCLHSLTLKEIEKNFGKNKSIRILDAGCGTGGLLLALKSEGYSEINGFDLSQDAINFCAERGFSVEQNEIKGYFLNNSKQFDVIISHDTLCYFSRNDQNQVLHSMLHSLKKGGLLLMNLPAYPFFKGTHDLAVGIKKRFTPNDVASLLENSNAHSKMFHWPFILSPIIGFIRIAQRLQLKKGMNMSLKSDVKVPYPFVNDFLRKITLWEFNNITFSFFGSSIFLIVKKE